MSEPTDQPSQPWTPPGGPPAPQDQPPRVEAAPGGPQYEPDAGWPNQPPYGAPGGQAYGAPGGPGYAAPGAPGGQTYGNPGGPAYGAPSGPAYGAPGGPAYEAPGATVGQPGTAPGGAGPYVGPGGQPWPGGPYGAGQWGPYPPRKSRRGLVIGLSALGVLLLVVVGGVAIVLSRAGDSSGGGTTSSGGGTAAPSGLPATRQADGSIALAKPGVTHPVLELYEDFQCPVCKSFEDSSGSTIRDLVGEGKVKVVYRPFRLFEQEPLRSNSARAANAAACAPADHWLALHDLLFQNQPAEGSPGFSAADLQQWGRQAGITDPSYATCVAGQQKTAEVESATSSALASGVRGTPTGRLDGTDLSTTRLFSPDSLRSAITGTSGGGAGQPTSA